MRNNDSPLDALKNGNWFKLICGASYQHLPAVRNLTLAYTLAGADCIDVAADPAVIAAAQEGLEVADRLKEQSQALGFSNPGRPWLMVSLNDGEDPHFRKAEFDVTACPVDCWRPCEKICPAEAIAFSPPAMGVLDQRCYGCGRCLPICPSHLIYTRSYVATPEAVAPLVLQTGVDAIEIHTQVGRDADFRRLWTAVQPWVGCLKLVAISCPDGADLVDYLWTLYEIISPLPCALIWQTDGRPMSGDIGAGATSASVKLSQKVLAANLPGYVQLAGGTNDYTVAKLRSIGLLKNRRQEEGRGQRAEGRGQKADVSTANCFQSKIQNPKSKIQNPGVAGVAYGSYARVLLSPILEQLEGADSPTVESNSPLVAENAVASHPPLPPQLETRPDLLWQAVKTANSLVSQLKGLHPIVNDKQQQLAPNN